MVVGVAAEEQHTPMRASRSYCDWRLQTYRYTSAECLRLRLYYRATSVTVRPESRLPRYITPSSKRHGSARVPEGEVGRRMHPRRPHSKGSEGAARGVSVYEARIGRGRVVRLGVAVRQSYTDTADDTSPGGGTLKGLIVRTASSVRASVGRGVLTLRVGS